MKIKKLISNKYLRVSLLLIAGFFAGWLVFHGSPVKEHQHEIAAGDTKSEIWTCSMHPQIRKDGPGQCPICGMDLIPLTQDAVQIDPNSISMTEDAARLAEVQTTRVSSKDPVKEIRLYGKVQADERLMQTQSSHIPGRVEQLLVNFTGEMVQKGQTLAQIYSPALITAQQELLEALKMKDNGIISAAREKLKQWKLSDEQISAIEKSGQPQTLIDILANVSGIVVSKKVNKGDYVQQGTPLYEIADLSRLWVLFDAYESDLAWIRKGDKITYTLQSSPGREYNGVVAFIDPVINAQTRVAKLRVEVKNDNNVLKPEMFVTGHLSARLPSKGTSIVVPHSAVLWTGTRSIVYVKVPESAEPTFRMREITLGPDLGNSYVVIEGLEDGEELVTNGTFNIDASAQLMGKPSMMNGLPDTTAMSDEMDMSDTLVVPEPIKMVAADPALKGMLMEILSSYNDLKNALVDSKAKKASKAARTLNENLKKVDMKWIGPDEMAAWMKSAKSLDTDSKSIATSNDIESQRQSFSSLSDAFYKVLKMYGSGQTIYYQFCPMAFDNKGAFWLSETDEILNPYFGKAMLNCGETREVIKN